jgi:hypothetical protein
MRASRQGNTAVLDKRSLREKKRLPLILRALALVAAVPARADRPVTDNEKAKLGDAVSAEGCSGGRMEFDVTKFEVEGAQCNEGRMYDLEFDSSYRLIFKKARWWNPSRS